MMASNKCYQLANALQSMSTRISFEDVEMSSSSIMECVSNVLTVREINKQIMFV
jgi:hypothetical protein